MTCIAAPNIQELLTSTADQILADYDAATVGAIVHWYEE